MPIQNKTFTGREDQKAKLSLFLKETEAGRGQILLISGEAGIGKTSLVESCIQDSCLAVYAGRSTEYGTPPFGPVVAILREFIQKSESKELTEGPLNTPPASSLVATMFQIPSGFPMFIEKIVLALQDTKRITLTAGEAILAADDTVPIPEGIRDAVLLRIESLSRAARTHLETAAIAGEEFDNQ